LQNLDGTVAGFDENLWSSLVDHITVMKDKKVVFTFKGGTESTADGAADRSPARRASGRRCTAVTSAGRNGGRSTG